MTEFLTSSALLLVLLNPFLVIIYLIDVVQKLDRRKFLCVMVGAGGISAGVFCVFAVAGDAIFSDLVRAEFASFQIFGGIVFLLIGIQFVFHGPTAIEILRGESDQLTGAIAIPGLIGPGTINASVILGKRSSPEIACASVLLAVVVYILIMVLLKVLHDFVLPRRERLVQQCIEIAGRAHMGREVLIISCPKSWPPEGGATKLP